MKRPNVIMWLDKTLQERANVEDVFYGEIVQHLKNNNFDSLSDGDKQSLGINTNNQLDKWYYNPEKKYIVVLKGLCRSHHPTKNEALRFTVKNTEVKACNKVIENKSECGLYILACYEETTKKKSRIYVLGKVDEKIGVGTNTSLMSIHASELKRISEDKDQVVFLAKETKMITSMYSDFFLGFKTNSFSKSKSNIVDYIQMLEKNLIGTTRRNYDVLVDIIKRDLNKFKKKNSEPDMNEFIEKNTTNIMHILTCPDSQTAKNKIIKLHSRKENNSKEKAFYEGVLNKINAKNFSDTFNLSDLKYDHIYPRGIIWTLTGNYWIQYSRRSNKNTQHTKVVVIKLENDGLKNHYNESKGTITWELDGSSKKNPQGTFKNKQTDFYFFINEIDRRIKGIKQLESKKAKYIRYIGVFEFIRFKKNKNNERSALFKRKDQIGKGGTRNTISNENSSTTLKGSPAIDISSEGNSSFDLNEKFHEIIKSSLQKGASNYEGNSDKSEDKKRQQKKKEIGEEGERWFKDNYTKWLEDLKRVNSERKLELNLENMKKEPEWQNSETTDSKKPYDFVIRNTDDDILFYVDVKTTISKKPRFTATLNEIKKWHECYSKMGNPTYIFVNLFDWDNKENGNEHPKVKNFFDISSLKWALEKLSSRFTEN